jgi:group II intron reverse transcriptase/maturase
VGTPKPKGKSFDIPKGLVWDAYQVVKENQGAPGVDGVTIEEFEKDLKNNLYLIWNRLSSGTYFPPAVKAEWIPKPHGNGQRMLGIPTVADRVAQTTVAMALGARVEKIFHDDSYGYRQGRSPLDAVEVCRRRCWEKDWVLELDIQNFFGSCPHELVVKAVQAHCDHDRRWIVLYVRRWLTAPIQHPDGTKQVPDAGTPQGSAISPVLANLFMTYAFDQWVDREFPTVRFERYCDDIVVHCSTERQARAVWAAVGERMVEVGLRLHPDKTRLVYCKDSKRRGEFDVVSFTFLGFTWQPRSAKNKRTGQIFTGFLPAMSADALRAKGVEIRSWRIHRRTANDLVDLAKDINPKVRGWMNYYGTYAPWQMYPLLMRINAYLMRWARKKYKRLKAYTRAFRWWQRVVQRDPKLFAHWAWTTISLQVG